MRSVNVPLKAVLLTTAALLVSAVVESQDRGAAQKGPPLLKDYISFTRMSAAALV